MRSARCGDQHMLALEPGERVLETLIQYCQEQGIAGGALTAIGGFSAVQLKYFDIERMEYQEREIRKQVEVVSLVGNVALVDGKPYIHAHVALGTRDYRAYAGHLGEATVEPTLEVCLTQLGGPLIRQKDPRTGLEALRPEAKM